MAAPADQPGFHRPGSTTDIRTIPPQIRNIADTYRTLYGVIATRAFVLV
jgi:hypothetical protein